jgi:hypothetical protein
MTTMEGYFDSARHAPREKTCYFGMELDQAVCMRGWETRSVYINDLRLQNGRVPGTAYRIVEHALTLLRANAQLAADVLLMEPEGLEGRMHAVGGGWIPSGSGVTFYIARNSTTDESGKMRMFLCADVSVRAT